VIFQDFPGPGILQGKKSRTFQEAWETGHSHGCAKKNHGEKRKSHGMHLKKSKLVVILCLQKVAENSHFNV